MSPRWQKIFVNPIVDKGHITKIYIELLQINKRKLIIQFKNSKRTYTITSQNKIPKLPIRIQCALDLTCH